MSHEDIPQELKDLDQWVVWQLSEDGRKIPLQITGEKAKSNDYATWNDFASVASVEKRFTGLGFVFSPGDEYFGIDLDCSLIDGEVQPWAREVLCETQTYTEVSPSGSGVKLWCRGKLPKECRNKWKIGTPVNGRQPAVEVYDSGRFFTVTGNLCGKIRDIATVDASAFLRWLDQRFPQVTKQVVRSVAPVAGVDRSKIVERAASYLSRVPGAVSGQHGHDQTFRAACVLVLGFGLSFDEALPIFEEWNQTCDPPWSDHDLQRKLTEADKQAGERGYLVTENAWDFSEDLPPVDLSKIMEKISAKTVKNDAKKEEFPKEIFEVEGFIGDVIRYNLATAMYPLRELAVGAAFSLFSVLTGRKIMDSLGTRSNLYIIGVSPSGAGKERGRKINREILLRCGAESMVGSERIGSSAAIISVLSESPATLFQLDEIGKLLATTQSAAKSPHLHNIPVVLMQLFTSPDSPWKGDAYADTKKIKTIIHPHCVIYGTTTECTLWENLTKQNLEDGFVSRCLVFESEYVLSTDHDRYCDPIPDELIDFARAWYEFNPGGNLASQYPRPVEIKSEPEAAKRAKQYRKSIEAKRIGESKSVAAIWSRSSEKANKIAMLLTASRWNPKTGIEPVITIQDMELAIKVSNFLTRRLIREASEKVSDSDHEKRCQKILQILETPCTKSDIVRRMQSVPKRLREEALSDLIDSEQITRYEEKTSTKPKTMYVRILREE